MLIIFLLIFLVNITLIFKILILFSFNYLIWLVLLNYYYLFIYFYLCKITHNDIYLEIKRVSYIRKREINKNIIDVNEVFWYTNVFIYLYLSST